MRAARLTLVAATSDLRWAPPHPGQTTLPPTFAAWDHYYAGSLGPDGFESAAVGPAGVTAELRPLVLRRRS